MYKIHVVLHLNNTIVPSSTTERENTLLCQCMRQKQITGPTSKALFDPNFGHGRCVYTAMYECVRQPPSIHKPLGQKKIDPAKQKRENISRLDSHWPLVIMRKMCLSLCQSTTQRNAPKLQLLHKAPYQSQRWRPHADGGAAKWLGQFCCCCYSLFHGRPPDQQWLVGLEGVEVRAIFWFCRFISLSSPVFFIRLC